VNPTELHTLFSAGEQTLLVATEPARLTELSEDDLDALLTLVRRARNKYTKLYRRQSADLVAASSSRHGTSTSNQRTKRKAEIFEDALARVARSLASAASATAKELKRERLDAASAAKGTPAVAKAGSPGAAKATPAGTSRSAKGASTSPSRQASTKAKGARSQAKRDSR
jgi:ABC-type Na+ efflux pump permease subunit